MNASNSTYFPIYIIRQVYKGGIWLIEIHFQRKEDAKRLHTFLNQLLDLESSSYIYSSF